MAYDESVAKRVRARLVEAADEVVERKMFGGLAFMVHGHMCCGIVGDELMVRVGPDGYDDALAQPHARAMDFTGRPMRGMVYVAAAGIAGDPALDAWIGRGLAFVTALPAK